MKLNNVSVYFINLLFHILCIPSENSWKQKANTFLFIFLRLDIFLVSIKLQHFIYSAYKKCGMFGS
jgi:hypothetical protein